MAKFIHIAYAGSEKVITLNVDAIRTIEDELITLFMPLRADRMYGAHVTAPPYNVLHCEIPCSLSREEILALISEAPKL